MAGRLAWSRWIRHVTSGRTTDRQSPIPGNPVCGCEDATLAFGRSCQSNRHGIAASQSLTATEVDHALVANRLGDWQTQCRIDNLELLPIGANPNETYLGKAYL